MHKILEKAKTLSKLVSVGDVHGKFAELGYRIKERYQIENSIISLCGDIGVGFHKPNYYITEIGRLDKIAKRNNNIIIAVRGNHDDPEYFNNDFCKNNGFSNVLLVPDYTVIESKSDRILYVGGGTSIDRTKRTLGSSYWPDEIPVYNEEKLKSAGKVSVVVTHSTPSFCPPTTKDGIMYWLNADSALYADLIYERNVFDEIYAFLKKTHSEPRFWVYGHYHMSVSSIYNDTQFRVLDELEFFQIPIKK